MSRADPSRTGVNILRTMPVKTATKASFKTGMEKSNLGLVYQEADAFGAKIKKDSEDFKRRIKVMNFKL